MVLHANVLNDEISKPNKPEPKRVNVLFITKEPGLFSMLMPRNNVTIPEVGADPFLLT
jgi:hypothetical protein